MTLGSLWLLGGCMTIPTPLERQVVARQLADGKAWRSEQLQTRRFTLQSYLSPQKKAEKSLTVFIEGDGFAWVNSSTPSFDPSPINPTALKIALHHPDGNAAYLARPCQFQADLGADRCKQRLWTQERFSSEIVDSMNDAVDLLKERFLADSVNLVGFSGGGTIAALLSTRRKDVALLVTIAGNLDIDFWAEHLKITPLTGSLNPAHQVEKLHNIRQIHFTGGKDTSVPPLIAEAFADKFPPERRPVIRHLPTFDHHCCWADNWAYLWRSINH